MKQNIFVPFYEHICFYVFMLLIHYTNNLFGKPGIRVNKLTPCVLLNRMRFIKFVFVFLYRFYSKIRLNSALKFSLTAFSHRVSDKLFCSSLRSLSLFFFISFLLVGWLVGRNIYVLGQSVFCV